MNRRKRDRTLEDALNLTHSGFCKKCLDLASLLKRSFFFALIGRKRRATSLKKVYFLEQQEPLTCRSAAARNSPQMLTLLAPEGPYHSARIIASFDFSRQLTVRISPKVNPV